MDANGAENNMLRSPSTWRLNNFPQITPWPPLFRGKRGGGKTVPAGRAAHSPWALAIGRRENLPKNPHVPGAIETGGTEQKITPPPKKYLTFSVLYCNIKSACLEARGNHKVSRDWGNNHEVME